MRIWEWLAEAEPLFFPEASPEMPLVLQTSSAIFFCGHVSWKRLVGEMASHEIKSAQR